MMQIQLNRKEMNMKYYFKVRGYVGFTRDLDKGFHQNAEWKKRNEQCSCDCASKQCKKAWKRDCSWDILNWDKQKYTFFFFDYSRVEKCFVVRSTTKGNPIWKERSLHYTLNNDNEKLSFCSTIILSTLALESFSFQN